MTSSETSPLGEDQQDLQDTLRGFLAGQLPPAALRAALETKVGYSPELHARLASELGQPPVEDGFATRLQGY